MRFSRKKIIQLCIELWEWLAKTGKTKLVWPGWEKYPFYVNNHCWFCYYDNHTVKGDFRVGGGWCEFCPYYKKFGHCNSTGTYFNLWDSAKTPRTRKKYAKLFLEQIKTID